jgi:RNA polymerase sigma-70 factor (ECF subfamily)
VGPPAHAPEGARPDRRLQDAWVARIRARDAAALTEVIAAFGERLAAVVGGLVRDRDAVDDVLQQTFAKAWFRIDAFQGTSSLYTWLYRVAVNAAKDHLKTRRRRPLATLDEAPLGGVEAGRPHVLEGLERRETRLRVRAAIERLPEHYRTVLALRELDGMP